MKPKFRLRAVAIYSVIGTIIVVVAAQFFDFPAEHHEDHRPGARRNGQQFRRRQFVQTRAPRTALGAGSVHPDFPLRKQFDKNDDKILDAAERREARDFLQKERAEGRGPRRGPLSLSRAESSTAAGKKLTAADVQSFSSEPLYDPFTLRTLFLEFENADWEHELDDFYHTDADVPAKLTIDGKTLPDIGVHFHGASSYFALREFGKKASLVLSLDMAHDKQNLLGYRTLDLLNSHTDPTFLHTILYLQIARDYFPAPKANFARVVINGENWGVYVNAQHFNKDFVQEWFPKSKGARWKVPGSPRGHGGLEYLGDDIEPYKRIYEIKTKDDKSSWRELIHLCRVLCETPLDHLEEELNKILDIDGALKFLALENALINSDGYWIRSSDYNLCQDQTGRFHIVPHDANETFAPPQRPGSHPIGEEPNVNLDPAAGSDDAAKPLLHRLLAVKSLRSRYFGYIRQIAEQSLDWNKLGPLSEKYHNLIAEDVKADTKKLDSFEDFKAALSDNTAEPTHHMSLKTFVEKRRAFLLNHPEVKKASMPLAAK